MSAEATSVTISAARESAAVYSESSLFFDAAGFLRLSANFFNDELKSSPIFFSGLEFPVDDEVPDFAALGVTLLPVRNGPTPLVDPPSDESPGT